MRNNQFVAEHRGGSLKHDDHRALMRWAIECSEHVLILIGDNPDIRLIEAIKIAKQWEKGEVKTGEAMKSSLEAHAAARNYSDPVSVAVARSVGQAVATAHMADHSLGAALYALKAIKKAEKSFEEEREWQNNNLKKTPEKIQELVTLSMIKKEQHFKL